MKLGETAAATHAGRKRRRNEDSLVVEPPLFAVADGMGGAQAGEIASQLAAAAFRDFREADALEPEGRVVALVQEANRRVYEHARADRSAEGMGTTITAALVDEDGVSIAHVGDSRAYRLRRGGLEQLTEDHSLVADLIRSGRLSPEEAEDHPQRSVITRALGTDPDVDVDASAIDAEPGDIFLLCSDGLTTMVGDDEIVRVIEESPTLEQAARALVQAANQRGGEDNVTVVLFSIVGGEAGEETAVLDGGGEAGRDDLEDTLTGLEPPVGAGAAPAPPVGADTGGPWPAPPAPPASRREPWRRRLIWLLAAVLAIVALVALAVWGLSRAHFVGAEEDGYVAVYQGLPFDLGAGLSLYRARYVSRLHAAQLSRAERAALLDHDLVTYDEARERLARYEEVLP